MKKQEWEILHKQMHKALRLATFIERIIKESGADGSDAVGMTREFRGACQLTARGLAEVS